MTWGLPSAFLWRDKVKNRNGMINFDSSEVLSEVANTLLSEELDYLKLSESINKYKSLLTEISELHIEDEESRNDIYLSTGKAIGSTWAAMCIEDMLRTKRFIKGIDKAVKEVLKKGKRPVEILYAGSGPFAALILPLTTRYTESEIRIRLLEINRKSCGHLEKLISELNLSDYIESIENVDATKYVVKSSEKVDILLSETMQRGLEKEQQVSIVVNLLNQLNDGVIVIPEKIELHLGVIESVGIDAIQRNYRPLAKVFELSKKELQKYNKGKAQFGQIEFLKNEVEVLRDNIGENDQFAIFTEIQIYEDEKLTINESGLTLPIILQDLNKELRENEVLRIGYEIGTNPGLQYEVI